MRLTTPKTLLYPVTVTKLLRRPGDEVPLNAPLFNYEYKSTVIEWDNDRREDVERERTWPATFESELEGALNELHVKVGDVLQKPTLVADVEETCKHEVQFGGLCAICGKDMSEVNSYNASKSMKERATINTVHGTTQLKISADEATKADEEAKRRLLDSRRLSLVVDLDQTVIHASVEPTIGEWQDDPSNPNFDALRDVCKFQLVDDVPGRPGTWYYIKLRPGLRDFLKTMSRYYEMHIYTMGTRAYAENIAKIIDPDRKVFGDRILSRDESGSMTAKNLGRLFPVDTKMVVIIDDRADVWHWIPNLVKVNVYEFFVGIGDINSSFLPKRPELETKSKIGAKVDGALNGESTSSLNETSSLAGGNTGENFESLTTPINGESSAVEQMLSAASKKDDTSLKAKEEEQDQTITSQLEDRPLLQKQRILDALEEDEAEPSPAVEVANQLLSEDGQKRTDVAADSPMKHKYRNNLLQDDDTELMYLGQSLRNIHSAYYDEYDKAVSGNNGSRVAELRPGSTKKRSIDEREHIPNAAVIMDRMKKKVLAGVNIVFSGVVPLGIEIQNHDTAVWAKSFGATVGENITGKTTHVIASPERRTAKVREAVQKGGRINIVSQGWLYECFSQWKKVDESPYRIHSDAATTDSNGLPDSFEGKDYTLSCSDDDAAQTEENTESNELANGNGRGLAVDTGFDTDTDVEDLEKFMPSMPRDDLSPTETEADWAEYDAEFAEFMGSDLDDDSDSDSVRSDRTEETEHVGPSPGQRKRKSNEMDEESEGPSSRLQKRKRQALHRSTSLTNVSAATNGSQRTDKRGASGDNDHKDDDEDTGNATDDDYDLEAALAAEMSRQSEEEEAFESPRVESPRGS